jgi:Ca2+-binding RTX toxin-like protein
MALPVFKVLQGLPLMSPGVPFEDALLNGAFQAATTSSFILDAGLARTVFKGSFTVSGGVVTGGTVTGFTAYSGDTKIIKANGYALSATALIDGIAQYQMGDQVPLFTLLFSNATKWVGSNGDDEIDGPIAGSRLIGRDGNDNLEAFAGAQVLRGGKGNDFLAGGTGPDMLYGGPGDDVFFFRDLTETDRAKDFSPKDDVIVIAHEVIINGVTFAGIGPGFLDPSQLKIGKKAKTPDEVIVYTPKTGDTYFDPDGSGAAAQVRFAKLPKGLDLKAKNFFGEFPEDMV